MKIVVLGLSLSSSWGNGHATTYRALLRALAERGHDILFLERDRPWYAANRDMPAPGFCKLALYRDRAELDRWAEAVAGADAVIVGSYVPEGIEIGRRVQRIAHGVTAFYDIDTPVTLALLERTACEYLDRDLIAGYDLYLSFTGGPTLTYIESELGSPRARVLYCSVDPGIYRRLPVARRWDLGYLGTYSADRQPALERLLIEAARRLPKRKFVVAGPQYPEDIVWPENVDRIEHLPPSEHAAFYSSLGWALNLTRADMIRAGFSPSVRLFEAAACGCAIVSDSWDGLDTLFIPGQEITIADGPDDVVAALEVPEETAQEIGAAACARIRGAHTSSHRAAELERLLVEAGNRSTPDRATALM